MFVLSLNYRFFAAVLLAGTAVLAGTPAAAQMGGPPADGDAPVAMAGGRMVRGTVSAVVPDHLTLKTEQGEVYQVALTPNTQVRKGREPMKIADVHVGDGVGAMGEFDAPKKTVHAMMLFVVDAEQIKKARENLGKTYIAGKITAIDELKLTVLRSDNVSQVIQVDEDTSFKRGGRGMQQFLTGGGVQAIPQQMPGEGAQGGSQAGGGQAGGGQSGGGQGGGGRERARGTGGGGGQNAGGGESITLADVKVGDVVAGQGALKAGVFVPTELRVLDPAARRRRPEGASAADAGKPAGHP